MGDVSYGNIFMVFECLETLEIGRLCEPEEQGPPPRLVPPATLIHVELVADASMRHHPGDGFARPRPVWSGGQVPFSLPQKSGETDGLASARSAPAGPTVTAPVGS